MPGTAKTTPEANPASQPPEGGQQPPAGGQGGGSGTVEQRLDGLEQMMGELSGLVRGMAGKAQGQAAGHEAAKLDRPTQATETAAGRAESLRGEIAAELGRLREQEKHDQAVADQGERLKKVEAALERAPRQFRRVEEFMGWARPGDE